MPSYAAPPARTRASGRAGKPRLPLPVLALALALALAFGTGAPGSGTFETGLCAWRHSLAPASALAAEADAAPEGKEDAGQAEEAADAAKTGDEAESAGTESPDAEADGADGKSGGKADAGAGADAQADGAPPENADKAEGEPRKKAPPLRLFGTVEFRSPIKDLPKWERVLGSEKKRPSFAGSGMDVQNAKVAERWAGLKAKLADASLKDKVRQVNNFFNQWPYKTDVEVWGVEDYWATPREFVQKSGDCEDYAISKYYALRNLGVPAKMLRVAAVKDGIRGIGHAVLVVFMDGDAYVLDNLTNLVLSHTRLTHYTPLYTVNEEFLWRHVKPQPKAGK